MKPLKFIALALVVVAFQLRSFRAFAETALTFGSTNSGTIALPGQEDRFTFSGAIGQRCYYDALALDGGSINVRLISPSGAVRWEVNHSSDNGPFYLIESGTYTLVQDGNGATTGAYSFRFLDLSNATLIAYGPTNSGSLAPQSMTAAYRFNGTNGQRIDLQSIASSSGNANWRLVSPADQTLASGAISFGLGEVVLPITGTYLVLIEGYTENIGALAFQFRVALISNATGSASGFGAIHSGDLLSGQTNSFTYNAPAGLLVELDSLTNTSPTTIEFLAPSGNAVFSVGGTSHYGPVLLPESGAYKLNVIASSDGSYSFKLLDLAATATNIVFGSNYVSTLDPGAINLYRVTGSVGQRLYYDSLQNDFDQIGARLIGPDGSVVGINGNSDFDFGPFTLSEPGTYYLFIENTAVASDYSYGFRLLDAAQTPASSIAFDTTVENSLNPAFAANMYRFAGTAGQRLFFDGAPTNQSATWSLYGPTDQSAGGNSLNSDFEVILPATGTYLLVAGNGNATSLSYSIRIVTPNTTTNALTFGANVSGNLAEPGQEDYYAFTGAAGQRLFYDALDYDYDSVNVQIIDPNGGVIVLNGNSDSDFGPFTLHESGSYLLKLKTGSDYTGDYAFRLIDAAQSPAVPIAFDTTVNGVFSPGTGENIYRFSGTAGQRLFFDAAPSNTNGSWYLYGPQNQNLGGNSLYADFEVTLPQTGTYYLAVGNGSDLGASSYSIRIVTPNTTTNALTLGANVFGSLDEAGEEDYYTFSATAGQRLYYDALDYDFDSISAQLIGPNGGVVSVYGNSDLDVGPFTLPDTGTYKLKLKAGADNTGDYAFRLIDIAQSPATTISLDTTTSGTITPAFGARLYRFTANAGQRLFFDAALSNSNGTWALYGPENQSLGNNGLTGDFEVTLPQSGTQVLVLGNGSDTNAVGYSVRIVTPNTITNALTLGTTTTGNLVKAGDEHRFTFTGAVGQRIFYDALEAEFEPINAQLISPSGVIVFINGNSDFDAGPFTLNESGTYTLLIKGSGDFISHYKFRLLDLAAAPILGYGASNTNNLNPQISAQLYRINGTAGDRIGITNLAASSGNAGWSLIAPNNAALASCNIQNNLGEVTLPSTGTYAILVAGQQDLIGQLDYQFRISLVSTASGGTSGFGITHGGSTTSGQTDSFSLTGPAGLPIYFDALTNNSATTIELISPGGITVFSINGSADAGPYFLPESGSYTLNVIGNSDGSFNFRMLDLTSDSASLSFGTAYSNVLSPAFLTDVYKFNGSVGQRLYYDAIDLDFDAVNATLFGPEGQVNFINANSDSDIGPFTLTESGAYYLAISSQMSDDTVDYGFRLIDVAQAPAQALTLNATVSGSLNPGSAADIYQVIGSAGQRIYFDAAATNNNIGGYAEYWQLFGPANQSLGGNSLNGDFEIILPQTGTNLLIVYKYYQVIAGNDPLPYSFQTVTSSRTTNALTLGATTTGTLNASGEEDYFTFTGTAGQRLYYDALDADFDSINVQLISPGGGIVFITGNSDNDIAPFTLNETGTYMLVFRGNDTTGDYSFRLIDISQAPAQNLGLNASANGTLALGSQANVYRVIGSAGQRVYFDGAATNNNCPSCYGFWQLYGPENQYLAGNYLYGDFEITLPENGTNVLVVYKYNSGSVGYSDPMTYFVQTGTPGSITNSLTLGSIVTGSLNQAAVEHRFTFSGASGQRIYYDALDADGDNLQMTIFDPAGNSVVSGNAESDYGPFTLPYTGTYMVLLKGNGDATGAYRFRLLDTATAPFIATDMVITNIITEPRGVVLYQFRTTKGLQLIDDWLSSYDSSGYYTIYTPNNSVAAGNYFGSDSEFTPAIADNYLLVLSSSATNVPYSFEFVPRNHAPAFVAMNSITNNEMVPLTITNFASDIEVPDDKITFALLSGPTNATFNSVSGIFSWTPAEDQGPGIYTITVSATDDGNPSLSSTNSYTITVNEVNRAPSLTVPATQTINELTALSVSASATDPDIPTNALAFSLNSPPSGMTINASSGAISWTPIETQGPFTNTITVVVTDNNPVAVNAQHLSTTNSFTVIVNEINTAPVLPVQTNLTINELTLLTVTNTAVDGDSPINPLIYTLLAAPPGAVIDANGVITWQTYETNGLGVFTITTKVTDTNVYAVNSTSLSATNSFTVTVNEINVAPVITVPTNQTFSELTLYTNNATATDSDLPANPLTFALVSGPTGMIVSTNGAISWTPTEAQGPSTNVIQIRVTDTNSAAVNATVLSVTNSFTLIVNEVNVAPVLTVPTNQTISELTLYTNNATATDADLPANPLTFALVSGPTGMIVSTNGAISWTPTEAQGPSTNVIQIRVADTNIYAANSASLSVTNSFTLIVNEVNIAPVLTVPTNQTINELTLYTNNATATDSDLPANPLTFALVSGPTGMIVSTNGAISWTPTEAQGPSTNVIQIRVTDTNVFAVNSTSLSVTNSFTITVNEVNTAPIVGALNDRAVNSGQTISFTATATDADIPANTLVFSLVNAPSGATVSSGGSFNWRPTVAQANTTNLIKVVATDNGSPILSGTNSFTVIVSNLLPVVLTPISYSNGQFKAQVSGSTGPDYIVVASSNLVQWSDVLTNLSPATPFIFTNTTGLPNRFYRVRIAP
jgi:hypothetical protein